MRRIIVFLLIIMPSSLFAFTPINTGNDLYHNLKLANEPQNMDDMINSTYALGYLRGSIDQIIFMQNMYYDKMFPPKIMTAKEREEYSKKLDFVRLNFPETGIANGQMTLIYKNYAEKYPEELNSTARDCILKSLISAYGWKKCQ